jgi:putative restriction endonuclease
MAKGVFMTRVNPTYDDLPELRYHFPKRYLNMAERCIGDWILYYEPRSGGGRLCYFATARVWLIKPDPKLRDHYYAYVTDYIEFPHPVPYREGYSFYERRLRKEDGSPNKGLLGWAVRNLEEDEYQTILGIGMGNQDILADTAVEGFVQAPPAEDYGRPLIEQLQLRPYRDRVFSKLVRNAYNNRCAVTGLQIINGGGRTEVEAAHVRSVDDNGPDSVRNGIALSRTVHWMFDRGIISMEDDGKLLIAENFIPPQFTNLFHPSGYANLPDISTMKPHPHFLRFHRETHFKG